MTCRAFDAVLTEPDNGASNSRLYKLISAKHYDGGTLPLVAENYLRAFCDTTISFHRRRWIGIALVGMLDASPAVASHMKNVEHLSGLGDVILSDTEREDTKIVAALILRQALEQGINGELFWTSEKVRNSMPKFPENPGPQWISQFQGFLDTLDQLALAKPITDPVILYPVSVEASDGFRWVGSDNCLAITIIQSDILTLILPDNSLRDIRFLDIPIAHIHGLRSQPSAPLHDSQSRATTHEPWDLALTLQHEQWTYLVNTSEQASTKFSILFQQSEDAKECEMAIKELRNPGPADGQHSGARPSIPKQRTVCRSSPINISRRRQLSQSSSDRLGKSPHTECQSPQLLLNSMPIGESHGRSHQRLSYSQPARVQPPRKTAQKEDITEAASHDSVQRSYQERVSRTKKQTRAQEKRHTLLNSTAGKRPLGQSTQVVDEPPNSTNSVISTTESAASKRVTPRNSTNDTGKLPKVSQTVKEKATQQLRIQQDVFDLPNEHISELGTRKHGASQKCTESKLVSRTQLDKTKGSLQSTPSTNSGMKTRSKRKREEDDDFVPDPERPIKNTRAKRKSVSEITSAMQQPKKKTKTAQNTAADDAVPRHEPSSNAKGVPHSDSRKSDEPRNEARSRRFKQKDVQNAPSSGPSSRPSLIGALVGSQKATQVPSATFAKPDLPARAQDPPPSPIRCQTQLVVSIEGPHTPAQRRKPLNAFVSSIPSSPPIRSVAEREYARPQRGAIEAEILSSNSKPVPASPHAESTAISGHADCDDISFEKSVGDMQTAMSDPFKKRQHGQKPTPFTRRLTGDYDADAGRSSNEGLSYNALDRSVVDNPPIGVACQSNHNKRRSSPAASGASVSQAVTRTPATQEPSNQVQLAYTEAMGQEERDHNISPALRCPTCETVEATEAKSDKLRKASTVAVVQPPNREYRTSLSIRTPVAKKKQVTTIETANLKIRPPQQSFRNKQSGHEVDVQNNINMDGDTTLVNEESEDSLPMLNASPLQFPSSPPLPGEPSSHSSTSAAPSPSSEHTVPTSEVEEMEWEASLKPHQRPLHDRLNRVVQRVSRHIFDNETAVTDIANMFADDSEHLLTKVLEQHNDTYEAIWEDMDSKKEEMRKEMERSVKMLARERKRMKDMA